MSKGILNTRIIYVGGLHPQMFKDFLSMDNDYDDVVDWVSNEMYGNYISIIESEEAENWSEEEKLEALCQLLEEYANDYREEVGSQFILGNETYTSSYEINVECTDYETMFESIIIFIAWIQK